MEIVFWLPPWAEAISSTPSEHSPTPRSGNFFENFFCKTVLPEPR
jgi:hypothetical protein